MSESTYQVGDAVVILDVQKEGEVTSVSDDGASVQVKYTDDAGLNHIETYAIDKIEKVGAAVQQAAEERAKEAAQAQADADAAANVALEARKTADELKAALTEESSDEEKAAAETAEQNAVEAEKIAAELKANAGVGTD